MMPPKDGLPGVPKGTLLKSIKGSCGHREAPRLWHLRAKEVLHEAGLEELQTARACFVLRHPETRENLGIWVLHVDDACFAGEGPYGEKAMTHIRKHFILGKEEYGIFDFLRRHVKQLPDCTIGLHQTE